MPEGVQKTDWNLVDGQGYILDRDRSHAAACRLNLQFYLWRDALGFNIDPSILPSLSKESVIADVASGTGIWLIDVSRQFPEAQLDGFDIVLRQSPHPAWLPPNVDVKYLNILGNIPDELIGKYDYVHTRLLVLVIEQKNPRPLIRNLLKLLKPGGYLQWDELDFVNMSVKKVDPNLEAPALQQMKELSWAHGRHDWTIQLPQFLIEEGFQNAKMEHFGDTPELTRAFNEQHLLTMEEFASSLVKLGNHEAASKYFRLIEEGYEESVAGAAFCVPRIVCVAQKPL
ncbi:hypothetical protein MFRU_007g02940 [Monilinia fructicola]|nr:hypothetical protein MFRU_007g02940 [Monilinia fructicola]